MLYLHNCSSRGKLTPKFNILVLQYEIISIIIMDLVSETTGGLLECQNGYQDSRKELEGGQRQDGTMF